MTKASDWAKEHSPEKTLEPKKNPIIERALREGSKSGGIIGDITGGTGEKVSSIPMGKSGRTSAEIISQAAKQEDSTIETKEAAIVIKQAEIQKQKEEAQKQYTGKQREAEQQAQISAFLSQYEQTEEYTPFQKLASKRLRELEGKESRMSHYIQFKSKDKKQKVIIGIQSEINILPITDTTPKKQTKPTIEKPILDNQIKQRLLEKEIQQTQTRPPPPKIKIKGTPIYSTIEKQKFHPKKSLVKESQIIIWDKPKSTEESIYKIPEYSIALYREKQSIKTGANVVGAVAVASVYSFFKGMATKPVETLGSIPINIINLPKQLQGLTPTERTMQLAGIAAGGYMIGKIIRPVPTIYKKISGKAKAISFEHKISKWEKSKTGMPWEGGTIYELRTSDPWAGEIKSVVKSDLRGIPKKTHKIIDVEAKPRGIIATDKSGAISGRQLQLKPKDTTFNKIPHPRAIPDTSSDYIGKWFKKPVPEGTKPSFSKFTESGKEISTIKKTTQTSLEGIKSIAKNRKISGLLEYDTIPSIDYSRATSRIKWGKRGSLKYGRTILKDSTTDPFSLFDEGRSTYIEPKLEPSLPIIEPLKSILSPTTSLLIPYSLIKTKQTIVPISISISQQTPKEITKKRTKLTKTPIALITSPKTKQTIVPISISISQQTPKEITDTKQTPKEITDQKPKQTIVPIVIPSTDTPPKKQTHIPIPKIPPPEIPPPPPPHKIPPRPKIKKKRKTFKAKVRRRGKFDLIGEFETPKAAFLAGKKKVLSSAAASFKVESGGRAIKIPNFDRKFYPSKRERGVIIQKRQFRIGSMGEKKEITYKGLASIKIKKLNLGGK